jgi:hypothetical protein
MNANKKKPEKGDMGIGGDMGIIRKNNRGSQGSTRIPT